jgi:hypothetical protein
LLAVALLPAPTRADSIFDRINQCEAKQGGACVFALLRQLAGQKTCLCVLANECSSFDHCEGFDRDARNLWQKVLDNNGNVTSFTLIDHTGSPEDCMSERDKNPACHP